MTKHNSDDILKSADDMDMLNKRNPILQHPSSSDPYQIVARELVLHGAAVSDAQMAKTARIQRILDLPPGDSVPSDGPRKRGRPITRAGALRREMGFSRLKAWKAKRLAEIPKEQFEALLDESGKRLKETGRELGVHGMLRLAGKLSPDRLRPHERGAAAAILRLTRAKARLEELYRKMREFASDEELQLLSDARQQVEIALEALADSSSRATAILNRSNRPRFSEFLAEREQANSTAE